MDLGLIEKSVQEETMMPRIFLKLFLSASALLLFAGTARASEMCKECHPDIFTKHAVSLHGRAGKDCESCHGGGADHVADPSKKNIITFDKGGDVTHQNEQCLSCHGSNQNLMSWSTSLHNQEDVACASCHSVHQSSKPVAKQPQVCFGCHKDIRALVNNFSHHPIIEGKVKCSDCHNPHGSMGVAMIKDESVNQLCHRCHSDKRGPYVWEHPPVVENCLNCHNPHGAKSGRLLNEKLPNLCENCHADEGHHSTAYGSNFGFGGGGNPSNKQAQFYGKACLNCHGNIHGSSAPAANGATGGNLFNR
jgi:DmsE family decaheme c-type cytochrome